MVKTSLLFSVPFTVIHVAMELITGIETKCDNLHVCSTTTTTTLLKPNTCIIVSGWPTPQIARKS